MVISAGPGDEPAGRVRAPVRARLRARAAWTARSARSSPGTPAAQQLRSRRPDPRGRRQEPSQRLDRGAAASVSPLWSLSTSAPGKQTDGCRAKTPVHLRIERDGQVRTLAITPGLRRRRRPHPARVLLRLDARRTCRCRRRRAVRSSEMWRVTTGTVGVFSRIFQAQERKKIHGIVGISDVTHQAFEFGAREALTLIALISLSLAIINLFPVPAARRRPHLLEPGREDPRAAGPVQRHGAGGRDRVRAGHGPVRGRALERHRQADRIGLQHALAGRGAAGGSASRVGFAGMEVETVGRRPSGPPRSDARDGLRGIPGHRRGLPGSYRDPNPRRRVQLHLGRVRRAGRGTRGGAREPGCGAAATRSR